MLKADSEYDEKSRVFDYEWLFKKVKFIVSGLDTKVNLRVSLHASMLNFLTMRQVESETNDDYLTRFKSSTETLKLAGGEHIFVSKEMLKVDDLSSTSKKEKMKKKIDSWLHALSYDPTDLARDRDIKISWKTSGVRLIVGVMNTRLRLQMYSISS